MFDGAKTPALAVYKNDGSIEVPELVREYNVENDAAGINISNLGPYFTEIKYFVECLLNDKEIQLAPLSEGVKSVELGLRELEAARKFVDR